MVWGPGVLSIYLLQLRIGVEGMIRIFKSIHKSLLDWLNLHTEEDCWCEKYN